MMLSWMTSTAEIQRKLKAVTDLCVCVCMCVCAGVCVCVCVCVRACVRLKNHS